MEATTERTLDERVGDAKERYEDALRDLTCLDNWIHRLGQEFDDIARDAIGLASDGYGHDPRHVDEYCPECGDIDALYWDSADMAGNLRTLRKIFGALCRR